MFDVSELSLINDRYLLKIHFNINDLIDKYTRWGKLFLNTKGSLG